MIGGRLRLVTELAPVWPWCRGTVRGM